MTAPNWSESETASLRKMYAAGKSDNAIALALDRTSHAVKSYRGRIGLVPHSRGRMPTPEDFAQYCLRHTIADCVRRYGVSYDIVARWRREGGIESIRHSATIAMPADFREMAPKLTVTQAIERWHIAYGTLYKFYREAGVRALRCQRGARTASKPMATQLAPGDGSIASQAAMHLRRYFPNVCKATVYDRAVRKHLQDEGRDHYAVAGHGFVHISQMIEMARAKGFQREIAA